MENIISEFTGIQTLISAFIGAASAIITNYLTSKGQIKALEKAHIHQLQLERDKYQREIEQQRNEQRKNDYKRISIMLNMINREFSITGLNIYWRSGMSEKEYDKKYFSYCDKFDEIRSMVGLSFPELSENLDNIYGQMNIFWGNFNNLLRLNRLNKPYEAQKNWHQGAFDAAQEINILITQTKKQLARLAL